MEAKVTQVLRSWYIPSGEKRSSRRRWFCIRYERHVKTLLFTGYLLYITMLAFDIAFATCFGYTITSHYISELGTAAVIPFPLFHDSIAILGGCITVLSNFYYFKRLKVQYRRSRSSKVFVKLGFGSGILGAIGYIFLGIFSLDRGGPGGAFHGIAMGCSFGGFIGGIFLYSLNIILTHKCKLKHVGWYGMTFPVMCLVVFMCLGLPLTEWLLLGSILLFLLPFDYYMFK